MSNAVFCTDEYGDFECYAFWHNGQQIPCPWVNDDGHIGINLLIKDAPEDALQKLVARIFGESPQPEGI